MVIIYGEGGLVNGRGGGGGGGGKQSFTLINRGGLNTMSRVQISIFIKEDSENAISNDLATQNFQNFPAQRHPWLCLAGVGPTKFNKLPTP